MIIKADVVVAVPGDADAVGSEAVTHPTYVQYVEGDGSTYIPANGQM
jgi:regulatory factor X 1/2/3